MGSKILVPRTLKKKENKIVIVGWSSRYENRYEGKGLVRR